MSLPLDQVICGDALEVLKTFPEESIDCLVTDPPYGLSFMGKDWDKAVPSVDVWRECLRVLKAGSFAFIMSSPRLDCLSQMAVRLSEAGFKVGFTPIFWTYASGFPKAENISLQIDKRACLDELEHKLGRKPNNAEFEEAWRNYRVVIGVDQTFLARNPERPHINDFGRFANGEIAARITEPKTEEAKALEGCYGGFQPKPAVEVIIVAMKPLSERTYVDQALKNGKGVTWLDNARIPFEENPTSVYGTSNKTCKPSFVQSENVHGFRSSPHVEGRFPANLLVSDDVLNNGKITVSTGGQANNQFRQDHNIYGDGIENKQPIDAGYGDSGSFSRYFDLGKWFEKTVQSLPEDVRRVFPFLIVSKASKQERNEGCQNLEGSVHFGSETESGKMLPSKTEKIESHKVKGNFHPTVKPVQLMSYLITLGSRPSDVILDPYIGSGSTALSARLLNRHYVGVELNPSYVEIAKKRLSCIPTRLDERLFT